MSKINYEDGINDEEAKTIAINYIIKNDMKIDTSRVGVVDAKSIWKVRFFRSNWSLRILTIAVDKETGWIMYVE
ncbi:MAG: hypothetical protein AB1629_04455 [Candidatus Omnitrophota bacterium]